MLKQEVMLGIAHELEFWQGFVKNERFVSGWIPDDVKTPDLQEAIYEYMRALPNRDSARVLDIGSGVVSILNGTFPKGNITTVDPLGALYPLIFNYAEHGLKPPVPCGGEEMTFGPEFDIVHISNAIDHAQRPIDVFQKMWQACKPGGLIIVQGLEDEAIEMQWAGFHQWNFKMAPETGEVGYTGKDGVSTVLPGLPEKYWRYMRPDAGRPWFIGIWRKGTEEISAHPPKRGWKFW
jgi:SAM-dependent methyltransferase